jgi:hypothetical protein
MSDDLSNNPLDDISIPEMRRLVDRSIAELREMRRALAVSTGMLLENMPGPVPETDVEEGRLALERMTEGLPLLRRRLTPKELGELYSVSAAQNEKMKEVVDELLANKEAFDELAKDSEFPFTYEDVVKLRESFDKTEMLHELEVELEAYRDEAASCQGRLRDEMGVIVARASRPRGTS